MLSKDAAPDEIEQWEAMLVAPLEGETSRVPGSFSEAEEADSFLTAMNTLRRG